MRFITVLLLTLSSLLTQARAMDSEPSVPNAWLQEQITVAEAEKAYPGITDDRVKNFPEAAKPFGFRHAEWEALKTHMQPGDQLLVRETRTQNGRDWVAFLEPAPGER